MRTVPGRRVTVMGLPARTGGHRRRQTLACVAGPALLILPPSPQPEAPMTIKSDRWIRRMAEEHGMIDPFEPGQVKEVEGRRIVSYGTSSYGYDVRCAGEFKVFTNIN